MIAMTEAAPGFFKVDLDSLATLHRVEYKDGFKGALTSVHPVVYPDGTVYNLVLDVSLLLSKQPRLRPLTMANSLLASSLFLPPTGHRELVEFWMKLLPPPSPHAQRANT